jgi:hypothetical protein
MLRAGAANGEFYSARGEKERRPELGERWRNGASDEGETEKG